MEGFPSAEQGDIADAAGRVVDGNSTGYKRFSDQEIPENMEHTESQLQGTDAEVARRRLIPEPGRWDGELPEGEEDGEEEEGYDFNAEEIVDNEDE